MKGVRGKPILDSGDIKTVAGVERALDVLDAFLGMHETLSLAEIAEKTSLYKSTILRLAHTLVSRGYLLRAANGGYQIGAKPFLLGSQYQATLRPRDLIVPVLEELARKTAESVSFNVPHENVRVVLYRVDSKHIVRDHLYAGDVRPLTVGSAGRVLTAFASEDKQHADIRRKMVAISFGEIEEEMAGVGAPVFDATGTLAGAVSVSGPRTRFKSKALRSIKGHVLAAAAQITQRLGGPVERFSKVLPRATKA